jgi:hypothetical protein
MYIESEFNIRCDNQSDIFNVKNKFEETLFGLTGSEDQYSILSRAISLETLIVDVKEAGSFLTDTFIDFTEDLMGQFNLSSARFTFMPDPGWGYAILTDSGLEYVGELRVKKLSPSYFDPAYAPPFDLIQYIPATLQFLALLGPEPDDALLAEFRSYRYHWVGLREDIDRNAFYTRKNIAAIWGDPQKASQHFISDRTKALKLAGCNS